MSQGAWIAGGDYRRVNGAATRFAETAVGKHPAPEGALRLGSYLIRNCKIFGR